MHFKKNLLKSIIREIFSDKRSPVPIYLLLIGTAILFAIGWYFTSDVSQSIDLLFWDEANYMQAGKGFAEKINRAWGPSYALWYKLISIFESDNIRLYYLNYRLMTILPAIVLFIFFALSNIRLWVSFSLALFFIFADINLPVWPKVSHYCIFVFLTGMILMKYIPHYLVKLSFISVFALFISYARPEFYLTYMAIIVLWVIALFYKEFRNKHTILISVGLILFGFGVQYVLKNPLFNFQGDRSALAFAQHFMFNYFTWNNIDQDFWITWMPYYEELFNNSSSIKEAYSFNGKLFNLHFLTNFQNYFYNAFYLFSDAMLPEKLVNIPLMGRLVIIFIGSAIMITLVPYKVFKTIITSFKKNTLSIVLLLLMVGPTVVSCFVIYPRDHYMVFHLIFVLFILSIIVFSKPVGSLSYDKYTFVFSITIILLTLWLMPSTKDYHHFDLWRKEKSQANLKTVEKLRAYHFTDSIRILENEGGMNLFLDDNFVWIRGFMKDTTWTEYLNQEKVNVVYVTPSLTKYPTLKEDSTWYDFEENPEQYGFKKIMTGNHQPYLYIKKNLLNIK